MPYIANNNFKQLYKWCFTLWFDSLIYKMGKRKKEDHTFLRKKNREKQNIATIMESVDGKGTVFPMKLKLQGEWFK